MIDPNLTFSWIPEGIDMINSSGFRLSPYMAGEIAMNWHFTIIEQLLGGIFIILMLMFFTDLYFKFTRRIK